MSPIFPKAVFFILTLTCSYFSIAQKISAEYQIKKLDGASDFSVDPKILTDATVNTFQNVSVGDIVKIKTDVKEKEVEVNISDSGHGISLEDQEHIFEPFFTTKRKYCGSCANVKKPL